MNAPRCIANARLPRWLLGGSWPTAGGQPALADIALAHGRVVSVEPAGGVPRENAHDTAPQQAWDVDGAPVLPGLVDAHTHLDKTFTLPRVRCVQPGLLGAIDAMMADRATWSAQDVRERATRGLQWAHAAGCVHLRSHVDWWEPDSTPVAWQVLSELAGAWRGRILLEQVSLIKLTLFQDLAQARRLARQVAATGPQAHLGAFVHSGNWDKAALRNVFIAADEAGLDVDLHVDEELNPQAQGLAATARILRETGFAGRVVCGHVCSLAAQPEQQALQTLDAVARAPITLVSLPVTNLLLQDATTGRTPRLRGITLVKEARQRGIPLLIATDNVQDPFCRVGSYDPVEAFGAGVLAAQLDEPFDAWSECLCRGDWLGRAPATPWSLVGRAADLVVFHQADAWSWPSRASHRTVLRAGVALDQTIATTCRPAAIG